MIESDYELKRVENNKENKYTTLPVLKKIDNLSYIKASNSSGKSTFLNMLALAFAGHKNAKINEALRSDIMDLIEDTDQKLKFKFRIKNRDGSLELEITKKNYSAKDIEIYEITEKGKKLLSPETIKQKYNLIYDIPNNPRARLKQLIDEISEERNKYGNRISALRTRIQELLTEISASKDPNRIAELKTILQELQEKHDGTISSIEHMKKEVDLVQKYVFAKFYNEYNSKYKDIMRQIEQLDKKAKKGQRQKVKENKKYHEEYDWAKNELKRLKEIYIAVSLNLEKYLPREKKRFIEIWEKIDFSNVLNDLEINEQFETLIAKFIRVFKDELDNLSKNKTSKEAQLYRQLLSLLKDYEDAGVVVFDKPIIEFIKELKKELEIRQDNIDIEDNIRNVIEELEKLDKHRKNIVDCLKQLKYLRPNLSEDEISWQEEDQAEANKKELIKQLESFRHKLATYKYEYELHNKPNLHDVERQLGEDLRLLELLNEEQLFKKITKLESAIDEEKDNEREYDRKIKNTKEQIEELEKQDEHKYKKYEKQLKYWGEIVCKNMDIKINTNLFRCLDIIKKKENSKDLTDIQKAYIDSIFNYLGSRMGSIEIHTGEKVNIIRVDLFSEALITDQGGEIKLRKMGTGQQQAAYLSTLLSTEDDRIIIAMFDEVGLMDENTLSSIKDKMRQLYDSNRLLFGLIVQKKEGEPEVTSI